MNTMQPIVRPKACEACPYRKDVPSGIWVKEEYAKLPPFDAETGEQPTAPFACHASPTLCCHGWAVVHGHGLLALRLLAMNRKRRIKIPEPSVPMFASGAEAAAHGMRDIKRPSWLAIRMMRTLLAKHQRLTDKPPTKRKTKQ